MSLVYFFLYTFNVIFHAILDLSDLDLAFPENFFSIKLLVLKKMIFYFAKNIIKCLKSKKRYFQMYITALLVLDHIPVLHTSMKKSEKHHGI